MHGPGDTAGQPGTQAGQSDSGTLVCDQRAPCLLIMASSLWGSSGDLRAVLRVKIKLSGPEVVKRTEC